MDVCWGGAEGTFRVVKAGSIRLVDCYASETDEG